MYYVLFWIMKVFVKIIFYTELKNYYIHIWIYVCMYVYVCMLSHV